MPTTQTLLPNGTRSGAGDFTAWALTAALRICLHLVGHRWENERMTHDPLCPVIPADANFSDWGCQCDLIAKARDEERWATVESAVYVASQYGAVPELVQLLSRLYEAPEVQMDDEVRREAARELTQLAQEMGMIP